MAEQIEKLVENQEVKEKHLFAEHIYHELKAVALEIGMNDGNKFIKAYNGFTEGDRCIVPLNYPLTRTDFYENFKYDGDKK